VTGAVLAPERKRTMKRLALALLIVAASCTHAADVRSKGK
jgi:hypothetical protein